MNLEEKDLPVDAAESNFYPIEMVRAIAVVWCFAALRSDEIQRLRIGCVRWLFTLWLGVPIPPLKVTEAPYPADSKMLRSTRRFLQKC